MWNLLRYGPPKKIVKVMMALSWPIMTTAKKWSSLPVLKWIINPFFAAPHNELTSIPINVAVAPPETNPIPRRILERFVSRVDDIFLLDECFCQYRTHMKKRGPNLDRAFQKLPGIQIRVNQEQCSGCGVCTERYFVNAIKFHERVAVITQSCKGCGQCVEYCPEQAVVLSVTHEEALYDQLKSRLYQQSDTRFSEDRQ